MTSLGQSFKLFHSLKSIIRSNMFGPRDDELRSRNIVNGVIQRLVVEFLRIYQNTIQIKHDDLYPHLYDDDSSQCNMLYLLQLTMGRNVSMSFRLLYGKHFIGIVHRTRNIHPWIDFVFVIFFA